MKNRKNWTAIVADDEPHLGRGIATLLEGHWPGLKILGRAENGIQALEMIRELKPDMAFLDIQMPGMTGLEVARNIDCRVVFITAHDHYAIEAFERAAVDYLLKPVSTARLLVTIDRLKQGLGTAVQGGLAHSQGFGGRGGEHWRLIKVKIGSDLRVIPVSQVFFFKAEDKYTRVQTREGAYLIRTPIKELEVRLDPSVFWRVHRSSIVNVDRIKVVKRSLTLQMRIGFDGLEETLAVSRAHEYRFKQM